MTWVFFGHEDSYRVNESAAIESCLSVGRYAKKTENWFPRKACLKASDKHGGKYMALVAKTKPGVYQTYYVHRIVATAFIPNPDNLPEVDHIDGDRTNNAVTNLRWVSRKQNAQYAADRGVFKFHRKSAFSQSKEDLDKLADAYARLKSGETVTSIATKYGVYPSTITNFFNGKLYKFFYEKTGLPLLPPRKRFNKRSGNP